MIHLVNKTEIWLSSNNPYIWLVTKTKSFSVIVNFGIHSLLLVPSLLVQVPTIVPCVTAVNFPTQCSASTHFTF